MRTSASWRALVATGLFSLLLSVSSACAVPHPDDDLARVVHKRPTTYSLSVDDNTAEIVVGLADACRADSNKVYAQPQVSCSTEFVESVTTFEFDEAAFALVGEREDTLSGPLFGAEPTFALEPLATTGLATMRMTGEFSDGSTRSAELQLDLADLFYWSAGARP